MIIKLFSHTLIKLVLNKKLLVAIFNLDYQIIVIFSCGISTFILYFSVKVVILQFYFDKNFKMTENNVQKVPMLLLRICLYGLL